MPDTQDRRTDPADRRWLRAPQQPSVLPDWMRDPPPPRRTLGDRIAGAVGSLPGARRLRERRWAREQRQKLYQRYPNTVKVVAFFLCWAVALLLVLTVYGLMQLA
ncbi:hypothetical protein [Micromonospora endolithica]|uniref:Uncharacterized protein n=1 Tax=Micromonospora endolithica TaxID=230091 RepID=A0A3A9ZLR6_9ACTN|nr:hypothetical protein [Micromonospora endolithica]RKN49263.1 hypothetical protein D7223_07085 [Micromonospora endolithica]TWJ23439.1 hypothetical protein JD76_03575 [Micromonospora endolithica]